MARESTTVAIVGGGVSGLTAAMLLRRCGVGCVVLERNWMSEMLHGMCDTDVFRARLARARFERVASTDIGARYWAEYMSGMG